MSDKGVRFVRNEQDEITGILGEDGFPIPLDRASPADLIDAIRELDEDRRDLQNTVWELQEYE